MDQRYDYFLCSVFQDGATVLRRDSIFLDTTDSVETHGTKQIIELDGPIAGPEAMAVMPSLNKII